MSGYLVFLQLFVFIAVQARPKVNYNLLEELLAENDANLNEGFDLNGFRLNQLELHNHYRALHGVPAMSLDNNLTSQAQAYAEHLAANELFQHCKLPTCDRDGAGENLAKASGRITSETNATKAWYDEIWFYNFCYEITSGDTTKRPGHGYEQVGHFTQVVWEASTLLGIGYARDHNKTSVYVVGRYKAHGNVGGQYNEEVLLPDYILNTYQDNCNAVNGGLTAWSGAGECSRSCGGGIQFKTRTCTNPKPSKNGEDCSGDVKALAVNEWCNIQSCSGDQSHRDLQCEERGKTADAHEFPSVPCNLYCLVSGSTFLQEGIVDDGTHCNADSGTCVAGVCVAMPTYAAPTEPPPTGQIVGQYRATPSPSVWDNTFLELPNGATNVIVRNNDYNAITIYVGYASATYIGYNWGEQQYAPTTYTTKEVSYVYSRQSSFSTITFAGPINPTSGYVIALYAAGSVEADITWSYEAPAATA